MTLQPYTPEHTCPKCGATEKFQEHWYEADRWRSLSGGPKAEHISIHCTRCHYEWYEAPLDRDAARAEAHAHDTALRD